MGVFTSLFIHICHVFLSMANNTSKKCFKFIEICTDCWIRYSLNVIQISNNFENFRAK